ncbi:CsbD family protein [Methylobacterium marchantiae]|uniref:CsbD family protein n=1 Tax=Methylobacterium marchantiae TaxID=600331 RepID=A0ABW3X336_9HYPH|nr:hypothetical protein AIGOOFII_2558 [Methylobacterium marchantiae]
MVDTDRITGAAKELGGKVQSAASDLTGSNRNSVEGRAREAQGAAENLYGQAKDAVRDVGDKVRDSVDHLAGSDADELKDRARKAQDAAGDYYDRAERSVRSAGHAVGDYAEDAYQNGGRYLRQGGGEVTRQIAEYPVTSLLLAGLLGFGIGLLVQRRD